MKYLCNEDTEPTVTSRDLQDAMSNVKAHFPVLGTFDHLNESLILLRRMMGWPVLTIRKSNVTKGHRPKVNSDTLKRIRELNRHDVALYEWASERLKKTIAKTNIGLEKIYMRSFQGISGIKSKLR